MIKKIDFEFTSIEIYDNFFVVRIMEGVKVTLEHHLEVMDIVNQYFSSPYDMILDEVNSYSVEFAVMMHMRNDPNIVCIGIVYYRMATKIALSVGKNFIGKPSKFSSDYNEVESWVKDQLTQAS
jgi:hypothetical protein